MDGGSEQDGLCSSRINLAGYERFMKKSEIAGGEWGWTLSSDPRLLPKGVLAKSSSQDLVQR